MFSNLSNTDSFGVLAIFFAIFLGGVLKGATGVGMPIVAIPVITAFYDIRLAVTILVVPNILSNTLQIYKYRNYNLEPRFTRNFAIAGLLGAALGTMMLAYVPVDQLNILMALIVLAYIVLRLTKPVFQLPLERAKKLAWYAGLSGGVLQGALGISGPVSLTFLNAIKLNRSVFIFTISVFFIAMCVAQIPLLIAYGLMNVQTFIVGLFAFIPLLAGLPVGEMIGRRMNAVVFDRVILVLLSVLALKQIIGVML
ncbi:sulfite exporter TauE/SafE family protein [uncultured Cocleimonas sp.]|uniref:sulfite exporter TauE/SafE family protein n=1 Tax=uncultured Cocleimonas sp. TaxID=1051587 RepID=UPI00261103FB|nr:sulfite exporter TauE/SafE family protein [uncultured Cocleimonas sp.]